MKQSVAIWALIYGAGGAPTRPDELSFYFQGPKSKFILQAKNEKAFSEQNNMMNKIVFNYSIVEVIYGLKKYEK